MVHFDLIANTDSAKQVSASGRPPSERGGEREGGREGERDKNRNIHLLTGTDTGLAKHTLKVPTTQKTQWNGSAVEDLRMELYYVCMYMCTYTIIL